MLRITKNSHGSRFEMIIYSQSDTRMYDREESINYWIKIFSEQSPQTQFNTDNILYYNILI